MPNLIEEAGRLISPETDLSMVERAGLVIGGLAVAAIGAKPRPNKVLSLVAIVVGSALAIRGAVGRSGIN